MNNDVSILKTVEVVTTLLRTFKKNDSFFSFTVNKTTLKKYQQDSIFNRSIIGTYLKLLEHVVVPPAGKRIHRKTVTILELKLKN